MPRARLDLDRYLRIPRVGGIDVSPDGRTVVFAVARPSKDGTKFTSDLWRVAADGHTKPERLTRGDASDRAPRFAADGSVVFLSNRAAPAADRAAPGDDGPPDEPTSQLWRLPAAGEPEPLTRRAGGVGAFALASRGTAVVFRASTNPRTRDATADRETDRARKKAGTSGLVFDGLPIRFWDRFLGPRHEHLFGAATLAEAGDARDLTPDATIEVDDLWFDVSPDGRLAVSVERERDEEGRFHENLVLHDLRRGSSRPLTHGRNSWAWPRFLPDGEAVVVVHHEVVPGKTGRQRLALVSLRRGAKPRFLARGLDLWPESPMPTPDGRAVVFQADEQGRRPLFRASLRGGEVRRLSPGGAFTEHVVAPDGRSVFAVRSTFRTPPDVVAVPVNGRDARPRDVTTLAADALRGVPTSPATSSWSKSPDGRRVHAWLLRPQGRAPRSGWPLLLWVHGGPLGAWTDAWHWRWNPQLFAARGHAVLLVNPRISTGYGQAFIEEGHGRWGGEPYEDLMAATDVAVARPDVDASRTAAMGGSYGGYMANWIAGRTRRFRTIVSHAGLWNLVGFHGTTDWGMEWEREFGGDPYRHPETYERWSPHRAVTNIRTPLLLVHGEKDYRVPVAEAFQAFTALQRLGVPSRLLYFSDENHWILRPPNIRTWHETIWAWLDRRLRP